MAQKASAPGIKRKKIQFAFYDEDAETVCVLGDFNGWNEKKHVMKRDTANIWRKTVMLRREPMNTGSRWPAAGKTTRRTIRFA